MFSTVSLWGEGCSFCGSSLGQIKDNLTIVVLHDSLQIGEVMTVLWEWGFEDVLIQSEPSLVAVRLLVFPVVVHY